MFKAIISASFIAVISFSAMAQHSEDPRCEHVKKEISASQKQSKKALESGEINEKQFAWIMKNDHDVISQYCDKKEAKSMCDEYEQHLGEARTQTLEALSDGGMSEESADLILKNNAGALKIVKQFCK